MTIDDAIRDPETFNAAELRALAEASPLADAGFRPDVGATNSLGHMVRVDWVRYTERECPECRGTGVWTCPECEVEHDCAECNGDTRIDEPDAVVTTRCDGVTVIAGDVDEIPLDIVAHLRLSR